MLTVKIMLGYRCCRMWAARTGGGAFLRPAKQRTWTSNEKAKLLNQSLQEGLKPKPVTTASTSTAATTPSKPATKNPRLQQAMINGVCSFLVVLLAAQSLKSGTERRKALQHLEAAKEVLAEKKEKLRRVQGSADELAEVCVQVVREKQRQQHSSSSWWGINSSTAQDMDDEELQRKIADAIRQRLQDMVEDSALSQTEKEQREVQELVAQIESPTKTRVFTI